MMGVDSGLAVIAMLLGTADASSTEDEAELLDE